METITSILTMSDLRPGDHVLWLYDSESEHGKVISDFVRAGIENNRKIIFVLDEYPRESIIGQLKAEGIFISPLLDCGQFEFVDLGEAYLDGGIFNPELASSRMAAILARSKDEDYDGVQITGGVSWLVVGVPGSEWFSDYEVGFDDSIGDLGVFALCRYNLRKTRPDAIHDALASHQYIIIGNRLHENCYYR